MQGEAMTPTILAALCYLADVEADAARARHEEVTVEHLCRLQRRLRLEVGAPTAELSESSPWRLADEYLAGRDLSTMGSVPPPPASSWMDLGVWAKEEPCNSEDDGANDNQQNRPSDTW